MADPLLFAPPPPHNGTLTSRAEALRLLEAQAAIQARVAEARRALDAADRVKGASGA